MAHCGHSNVLVEYAMKEEEEQVVTLGRWGGNRRPSG